MQRYRVLSRPPVAETDAYRDWLVEHAAEVVLAGSFAGAEIAEAGGTLAADYAADPARLDRYVAEVAPALRAEAERLFPDVRREREVTSLAGRVTAPFPWEALGLAHLDGTPVPCPADGPFTLHYVAPWCPDCHSTISALASQVKAEPRSALVGLFAEPAELRSFFDRSAAGATAWVEPSAKTETDRVRSFHATLRYLEGDARKWGVPATRTLFVRGGRFVARWS